MNYFGRIRRSKDYKDSDSESKEAVNFGIQYVQAIRDTSSLAKSIIDEWEAKGYKVTIFGDSILIEEKDGSTKET